MSNVTEKRLLTVKEAAQYLTISERLLWTLTDAQKITATRMGRAVRYDPEDLERFIEQSKSKRRN
jgi:excisionase family DNA binding protein